MDINQILTLVFSGIVAISTIVYAILTSNLVKETKAIRLMQITPDVQIYLEKAETDAHLVYFIIENLGFGIASDVRFTIIKDFEFYESDRLKISNIGSVKHGLSSFYPKQRYKYFFTNLLTDFENKLNDKMEVQISFKDILNNEYKRNFVLRLSEILGSGMMMSPPDSFIGRISYELTEINKKLDKK